MPPNLLVSIYIPTHNRSCLLRRALDSVVSQTYKNLEVIVINDGSQDDTNAVVQEYMDQVKRLILLENDFPKGACYSRNRGIEIASGTFITGLDDDDEFKPNHIEILLSNFKPEIYSFIAVSNFEDTGAGQFYRDDGVGEIGLNEILHSNVVGNQVFTKTKYLQEIGGFDIQLPASQDYDTWVRLIHKYGPGLKIKEATYIWYTGHELNRITNNSEKRLKALDMFYHKHSALMSDAQKASFSILRYKSDPKTYSLYVMINKINRYNYKSALSLYININLPIVGKIWRRLKVLKNHYGI